MLGPWTTSKIIETSTGASTGTVMASPSALGNHGQDFGVWLRSLPLACTSAFAGYADSTGPFRFVSTALTVPARQVPPANGGTVLVALGHNGGATPRPYADIEVLPGGGAGSISYICNAASGRFTISPKPGDRVTVSVYYDQKGHYFFTAADTTQGTGQTVSAAALYAGQMPLNSAEVLGMISNAAVTTPRAGIRLWQFTGIRVTTYNGTRSTILGPTWATSESIDTTGGTPAGAVVMSASTLSSSGQKLQRLAPPPFMTTPGDDPVGRWSAGSPLAAPDTAPSRQHRARAHRRCRWHRTLWPRWMKPLSGNGGCPGDGGARRAAGSGTGRGAGRAGRPSLPLLFPCPVRGRDECGSAEPRPARCVLRWYFADTPATRRAQGPAR